MPMEQQRDQVSWAAARAIGSTCQLLLSDLSTATSAARVACCLRTAISLFAMHQLHTSADQSGPKAAAPQSVTENDLLQRCYEQLQPHAAMLGWDQLSSLFYQCQFSAWAAGVLTVAAGEWLPRLQGAERNELWGRILDTFMLCPACHALSRLMGHLSAVSPQALGHNSSSTITALAADSAAELLLQRFLLPDSQGMQQLLAACDAGTEQQLTSCAATTQQLVEHPQQAQQRQCVQPQDSAPAKSTPVQQICMSEGQMLEAAALLAAMPDRLQVLQAAVPQLPHTAQIVTTLVQQCMEFITNSLAAPAATQTQQHPSTDHSQQTNSCVSNTPGNTAGVDTSSSSSSSGVGVGSGGLTIHPLAAPGAVHLTAMLLQKLVTRGHGSTVAAALLQLLVQSLTTAGSSKGYPISGAAPAAAGSGHGVGQRLSSTGEGRQQAHAAGQQVVSAQDAGGAVLSYIPGLQQVLLLLVKEPVGAAAAEKLLVRILQQSSREIQPQQQQQRQQQQQVHETALQALLCPLLHVSAHYRSIALNKLLLGRTLPTSMLQQLLQLLAACSPSLLPEAAATLAKCWCDNSTILHVPVSQQAYITAALVACLQQLPKDLLDPASSLKAAAAAAGGGAGTAALAAELQMSAATQQALGLHPYTGIQPEQASLLLPSIIQGVSTRLGSPSPAIRLQAMRVGRAFAAKLDPSKPMFDDVGPLELMAEEQWPCALQSQQPAHQLVQQQRLEGQQDNVQEQQHEQQHYEAAAADSSDDVSFKALARLAAATEGPDSDDEDTGIHPAQTAASTPPHQPTGSGSSGSSRPDTSAEAHSSSTAGPSTGLGSGVVYGDSDAASDTGSEGSASSLVAFDLQEDMSAEQWWGPDGLGPTDSKALGLRAVAAALRKQDDMAGALEALKKVEVLVRAEPDELPVVAPELARALIHCKVTLWADTPSTAPAQHSSTLDPPQAQPHTTKGLSSNAEIQRQRALVAVLSLSPLTSGDTVIAELYSPNLDQHQRVMILDGLASAAVEMSDPRKAPQLALQGPQKAPELLPPAPSRNTLSSTPQPHTLTAEQQSSPGSSSSSSRHPDGTAGSAKRAAAPGMVEASSRVWGKVSLQKQAQEAANPNSSSKRTFRNRFAPVALRWAAALLLQCDVRQQGIDLFGRDSLLLGRLLTVLGAFVEAAAETPAATPLCVGLLELLKAQEVSGHKEAYVRRSALVAASQVVHHLPAARLAGALVGRRVDAQDEVLVERLQWLMSWAQQVATSDVDQHCKLLAAGCVAWHMELSDGAMAVLEHLPEPEGPSLAAVGPGGRRSSSKQDADIKVQLPTVERLVLS